MSDTFKYLEQEAQSSGADAAQSFLDSKLKQNKHYKDIGTAMPLELRDQQGASSDPYAWGEGLLPGGEAYKDQEVVLNQDEIDAWNLKNSSGGGGGGGDKYRGFAPDSDSGRNYSTGAWGKGELDAEALAAKFGLDRSQEGRGEGHIWGKTADGQDVYIGKSSMDLASNSELISAHSKQANPEEVDHSGAGEALSSSGDIKGAILTMWDGGGGAAGGPPAAKKGIKPIEHSAEIKQAKDRVRSYEEGITSGQTSKSIFGGQTADAGDANAAINSRYSLDLNKGGAGIGTAISAGRAAKSQQATSSFLDNKLGDLKKAKNFQPV